MTNQYPKKSESWKLLFFFLLYTLLASAILFSLLKLSNVALLWTQQVSDLFFVGFIFYYYSRKIPDLPSLLYFSFKRFFQGFFAYFFIFLLTDELFVFLLSGEWKPLHIGFSVKWLTVLSTGGFFAPIFEEILFRGIILKLQTLSYGLRKAVIFNGIIFGILHFGPIPGLGMWSCLDSLAHGFFFALFLAIVVDKTRNLSLGIGFHIANNFLTLITS